MLNPIVTLSHDEQRLARYKAGERHSQDRSYRAVDLLKGDRSRKQDFEEMGVSGELAFARWYGLPFAPLETLIPGAADFYPEGVAVEIKTTDRINRDLIIPIANKPGRAQIYVFVYSLGKGRFQLAGWTTQKIAFQDKYVRDLGRGKCRVVPTADLYDMAQLKRAIRQYRRQLRSYQISNRNEVYP